MKKYEITVENADQPGLPEPIPLMISKTNGNDSVTLDQISKKYPSWMQMARE